jgi:hypothetical protein
MPSTFAVGRPKRRRPAGKRRPSGPARNGRRASANRPRPNDGGKIAERFGRAQYQEFVTRFLHDRQAAEEVERFAERLAQLMQSHHDKVKPAPKFATLEALNRWYQEHKLAIMKNAPPELLGDHLLNLDRRYDELSRRMIEETNL